MIFGVAAETIVQWLGNIVVWGPVGLLGFLGIASLLSGGLSERLIGRSTQTVVSLGLLASVLILGTMLAVGLKEVSIELGDWVVLHEQGFHFNVKFVFDRLSLPFLVLIFCLCGTVGAFTTRYLHRDPGYTRFFVFYSIFLLGMVVSAVAGTIEILFFGWELVGLSSALLVAYFHERVNPVRNGHRVWIIYRIADAAFLVAAIVLHTLVGSGDFSLLMGSGVWPDSQATLNHQEILIVGLLLLVAVAGKSALVPFSGWLPRAMEGPTPSSAVFYGALSVHLGTYLLLRVEPILEGSLLLTVAVCALGLVTAVYATLAGRVQSDVKTALAFASLTQVGVIVFEIGMGWNYLALVHTLGHACLRTLQLLRAPTVLHDFHQMANAVGGHLKAGNPGDKALISEKARLRLYRFSLERGYFEGILDEYVARPIGSIFRWSDRMERRWTDWLSGSEVKRGNAPEEGQSGKGEEL